MTKKKVVRPDFCFDEHLDYLDELRASGDVNMFGSEVNLMEHFSLIKPVARAIVIYWMSTFPRDEADDSSG